MSYRAVEAWIACLRNIALLFIALACRAPDGGRSADPAHADKLSCAQQSEPMSFVDPHAAFKRYAEAINTMKWCEAISAFDPAARVDLAMSSIKGFVLLAGANNPKHVQYADQLGQFCVGRGLDRLSTAKLATLTASLMSGTSSDDELGPLADAVRKDPQGVYADIMDRLRFVDQSSITKLDTELKEVALNGDTATALARQQDGRVSKLSFARTSSGWLMTVK